MPGLLQVRGVHVVGEAAGERQLQHGGGGGAEVTAELAEPLQALVGGAHLAVDLLIEGAGEIGALMLLLQPLPGAAEAVGLLHSGQGGGDGLGDEGLVERSGEGLELVEDPELDEAVELVGLEMVISEVSIIGGAPSTGSGPSTVRRSPGRGYSKRGDLF